MEKEYVSPKIEILDMASEGVLCARIETLYENDGIW